jgi:hypothetical protein
MAWRIKRDRYYSPPRRIFFWEAGGFEKLKKLEKERGETRKIRERWGEEGETRRVKRGRYKGMWQGVKVRVEEPEYWAEPVTLTLFPTFLHTRRTSLPLSGQRQRAGQTVQGGSIRMESPCEDTDPWRILFPTFSPEAPWVRGSSVSGATLR